MKKLKRLLAMSLAAMTAVSAMSITAFAAADHEAKTVDPDVQVVAVDENGNERIIPMFYDEKAAALSEQKSKLRASIPTWSWSRGNYTVAVNGNSFYEPEYVFSPTSGRIGVDSILYGLNYTISTPCIAVNDYTIEQGGNNGYVGSFLYDSLGSGTYDISYTVRGLTNTHTFRFAIIGNGNWSSGNISIHQ